MNFFPILKKGIYYWVLLYRMFIVLFIFFMCRIAFFLLNRNLFTGITAERWLTIGKGGLVFVIAAMFYFNSLFLILSLLPLPARVSGAYQKILKYIFFTFNGIAIALNCIDFIYYRFTLRRTTRSVFSEFANETNKTGLFESFIIDFWYVVVIFIAFIFLMVWLYNLIKIKQREASLNKVSFYLTSIITFIIGVTLAIGGIRGDFKYSTRPITISNAGEYVKSPNEIYLVLNTPFCMVRTWNVKKLEELHYYSDAAVEQIFSPIHIPQTDTIQTLLKKNIVIFILESFGKEAIGGYNKDLDGGSYKGYTPFIDSLMKQSLVYENSFANGRKSIDAIPSILASIPNGHNPFVLTPYASDSVQGLPKILKEEGYHASFFHGGPNGSMGFKAIVNLLGIENYFGKTEYNNDADFDGTWGIWDEPFFKFFANKLSSFREPFFSAIFSVSSHHPFKIPEKYTGKFKKGPLPVLECIGYTDYALRQKLEKTKKTSWFKNTLFVITADHATVCYHPEYLNPWGEVAIPILFYAPGDSSIAGVKQAVVSQIDIMPSILSYLYYSKPYFAFGESVFDKNRKNFSVTFTGNYRWIENDYLLLFDGKKSSGLYQYKTDRLFNNNLVSKNPGQVKKKKKTLKAYIQQYNNRLIQNRLTPFSDLNYKKSQTKNP